MLGIGLGGFTSGVETGVGIGAKISKIREERKKASAFKDAYSQGSADYTAAVESGDATAGDLDGPMRYAMPNIMAGSKNFDEWEKNAAWIQSDQATQGSLKYASGALKGTQGDLEGGLDDLIEAARLYGQGGDMGYESLEGGRYRGWVKDKDGKEFSKEFDTGDDLFNFLNERTNPLAAHKQWQADQAGQSEDARAVKKAGGIARAKTTAELEGKALSKNLGLGTTKPSDNIKARKDAIEELERDAERDAEWRGASEEKRERMIQKRKALILGRDDDGDAVGVTGVSSAPRRKVFVESRTGKLVSD